MLGGIPKRKRIPLGRGPARARRPASFTFQFAAAALLIVISSTLACAQNAPAPGFDPRAAERRFEAPQSDHRAPRLPLAPRGAAAMVSAKPLFVLRGVDVRGAHVMLPDAVAQTYRSYLGRRV